MDEIISHIRANFKTKFFVSRLFGLTSSIGRLLSQPEAPNGFVFIEAFWASSESTRLFFQRLIQDEALQRRFDVLLISIELLKNTGLWTQDNFYTVEAHAAPDSLAEALCALQNASIFTELNVRMLVEHEFLSVLARALSKLQLAGILTQANFTTLLHPSHINLLNNNRTIWVLMPPHSFTQRNFDRLIQASEQANAFEAIQRVFDQIIGRNTRSRTINEAQSTHTASIHRSVSESALRLKASYGENLVLQKTMMCFQADIDALPNDILPYQVAKRAMARLIKEDGLFKDPCSDISILELLALAYLAIGDDKKRLGSIEDAKSQLIQGLYEIQRGYNLNETGVDGGSEDLPICPAGAFNKLLEKLSMIHSDVVLVFVTPELASLKFPRIVKAVAMAYLKKQDAALLETINANNGAISSIWEAINLEVEDVLWDEFKEAFLNNRADNRFKALINTGVDVALSSAELLEIKRTFPASVTLISFLRNNEVSSDTPHAALMSGR